MKNVYHDDVIKWKHFPCYWPFVRGIHRSTVNSLHKGQWRGALMFSLICSWINSWVNNREAGDLKPHRAYYDVSVMLPLNVIFRYSFRANAATPELSWMLLRIGYWCSPFTHIVDIITPLHNKVWQRYAWVYHLFITVTIWKPGNRSDISWRQIYLERNHYILIQISLKFIFMVATG